MFEKIIAIFLLLCGIALVVIAVEILIEFIVKNLNKNNEDKESCNLEINGVKVMTVEEIVKDSELFIDISNVVRYLYTKDKERDLSRTIGFIKK